MNHMVKIIFLFFVKKFNTAAMQFKKNIALRKIAFWHWCSPVNSLHFFRTPFSQNTSGGLLLNFFSTPLTPKVRRLMAYY